MYLAQPTFHVVDLCRTVNYCKCVTLCVVKTLFGLSSRKHYSVLLKSIGARSVSRTYTLHEVYICEGLSQSHKDEYINLMYLIYEYMRTNQ